MTLIADAERAEDIADAFSKFRAPLSDQGTEVASVIEELWSLSRALRTVHELSHSDYSRNLPLVQDDLDLVTASVDFTLKEVWNIIGNIGNGAQHLIATDYRSTWKEIHLSIQQSGRKTLASRLEMYKLFIKELIRILQRRPISQRLIEGLRFDIRGLLNLQDQRMLSLTSAAEDLSLTPVNKRSYERERLPSSPTSSRDNSVPPWLSSPPQSPISPTATFSTTSWNSTSEMAEGHWACEVFTDLSVTALPISSRIPECHGTAQRDALEWLRHDEMERILTVGFGGTFKVSLFVRERDHRARILCATLERSGHHWYSCMPFNKLLLQRKRSVITLCSRIGTSNRWQTWAILPFTSMERLVLFYNTSLALRAHDTHKPANYADFELTGEDCPFAGQIYDDGYHHALRIFRDPYSSAIRLQASVCEGPMEKFELEQSWMENQANPLSSTPVWTAFITHNIQSRTWIRRDSRKVVCLRQLRRHVFHPRYSPPLHDTGEHMLQFLTEGDALGFMDTIDDIAQPHEPAPEPSDH